MELCGCPFGHSEITNVLFLTYLFKLMAKDWDELLASDIRANAIEDFFVHLGHINLQSYHFCGLQMLRDCGLINRAQADVPGLVHVVLPPDRERSAHFIAMDVQFFARVNLKMPVSVRIMRISDEPEHWAPGALLDDNTVVPLLDVPDCGEVIIWGGSGPEAQRRLQAAAAAAERKAQSQNRRNAGQKPKKKARPAQKHFARPRSSRKRKRQQPGAAVKPKSRAAAGEAAIEANAADGIDAILLDMLQEVDTAQGADENHDYQVAEPSQVQGEEDEACEEEGLGSDRDNMEFNDTCGSASPSESSWASDEDGVEDANADDDFLDEDAVAPPAEPAAPNHGAAAAAGRDLRDGSAAAPGPERRGEREEAERVRARVAERAAPMPKAIGVPRAVRSFANRTVFDLGDLGDLRYYHKTGVMTAFCRCASHHGVGGQCRQAFCYNEASRLGRWNTERLIRRKKVANELVAANVASVP